jgi:peptidyl-prolyl cis-trans isomerase B (cyclophilin B)
MKPRLLVLLLVLALAACGGDEPSSETAADSTQGCETAEPAEPKDVGGLTAPTEPLDEGTTYRLKVETNCGAFTITLDQASAPKTAASLVALAQEGFFDGIGFHRVAPGFVIQGGDPTASGTGGPGYSTKDRVPADAAYVPGVVAMAKAGNEPAGTAGSQFFVVTGADTGLTPDYALLGKVTKGMDVVQAIGELGDPASGGAGTPLQSVVIEGAKVRER